MTRNKKGAILITALWILAILSILAVGIGFRVSMEARLAKYNIDAMRALYLAKAGAAKAIYRLSKNPPAVDSIYECGIVFSPEEKSDPEKMKAIFSCPLGEGYFDVAYKEGSSEYKGISDEDRKININTAPENVLKNLLMYVGEDPTIAADITGWRGQGPALSDGYYESLPAPYKCKHSRFCAIEELMLVKGIDPKIFDKIKPYITVYGSPDAAKFAVNVNTAPKTVLSVLIMSNASVDTPIDKIMADAVSDRIIAFRNGADGIEGTRDDNKFFSAADMNIEAITQGLLSATQAENLKKSFTTASRYFKIESTGTIDRSKVSKKTVYVTTRDQKGPVLIFYREY